MKGKERFDIFIKFKVGSGEEIWFWDDIWCGNSPLKDEFGSIFLLASNRQDIVADNFKHVGGGVWCPSLRRNLNDWGGDNWLNLLCQLEDCKLASGEKDKCIW